MSTENAVKGLAKQLRNVGPKLAAKLFEAEIDSPEKLRQLGAKKAFERYANTRGVTIRAFAIVIGSIFRISLNGNTRNTRSVFKQRKK